MFSINNLLGDFYTCIFEKTQKQKLETLNPNISQRLGIRSVVEPWYEIKIM